MEKQLRILGLIAVLGVIAIVVSQGARTAVSPGQSGPSQQSDVPVAGEHNDGLANDVLRLLSQTMCSRQSLAITTAEKNGHPERVDAVIRVNCASMLRILTPEKQKGLLKVFEIEKYRPTDAKWAEVARTKSGVKDLLSVSAEANKAAVTAVENVWAPIMKPKAWELEMYASAEWKAASKHERNVMHYERNQAEQAKNPPAPLIVRQQGNVDRWEQEIKAVLPKLTPAQQGEFTRLLNQHATETKAALEGARP